MCGQGKRLFTPERADDRQDVVVLNDALSCLDCADRASFGILEDQPDGFSFREGKTFSGQQNSVAQGTTGRRFERRDDSNPVSGLGWVFLYLLGLGDFVDKRRLGRLGP